MDKITSIVATNSDVDMQKLLKKLKKQSTYFMDIDETYKSNIEIISLEREFGVRRTLRKAYDVINNKFFVEEEVFGVENIEGFRKPVQREICTWFENFPAYYRYLQGDIYDNASYYKYKFSQSEIDEYSIDISKINQGGFIDYDISEFTLVSDKALKEYKEKEKYKAGISKWVDKFNKSLSSEDFWNVIRNFKKSGREDDILRLCLSCYILKNLKNADESAFNNVMNYANGCSIDFAKNLCLIYNPRKVYEAYNSTYYAVPKNYKRRLRLFVEELESKKLTVRYLSYFDTQTHFFICKRLCGEARFLMCFDKFEDLAAYLKNDLSCCNLSEAILPGVDFAKYTLGKHAILPIQYQTDLTYNLTKKYDRYKKNYTVEQEWVNENGDTVKYYSHSFNYFFDFVRFLRKDLSNADLLFCDGLSNIKDFGDLNLEGAIISSSVCDLTGKSYDLIANEPMTDDVAVVKQNEIDTAMVLSDLREPVSFDDVLENQVVYYVSDIHLEYRIKNANCRSENDRYRVIQLIVDNLVDVYLSNKQVLLIGGDVSSDFSLFKQFIVVLKKTINEKRQGLIVVITLGNHELWGFPDKRLNDIVAEYRTLLADNGMYLLQNDMVIIKDEGVEEIYEKELSGIEPRLLNERVNAARLVIFGGIGFSGYNKVFNADNGIYRGVLSRKEELCESKKIESLYKQICDALPSKRVIIFTHMPLKDWCMSSDPHKNYIYVSGHNHRNYFYDDGIYRIYSDNQIGYRQENVKLKNFLVEDKYDIFVNYKDGVYEITAEQYKNFYRGKNIKMAFNRVPVKLYMLKKNGVYMFVEANNDRLYILCGGKTKRLCCKNICYYYENMDLVVERLKLPLDKYSRFQKKISDKIKAIGGSGEIHGAIIDIDYFNHIYVNPFNSKVVAYAATDIVNKVIYPNVATLLESNCQEIYRNYLLKLESGMSSIDKAIDESPAKGLELYLDTDIYKASYEIKKMQRLYSDILSEWVEPHKKTDIKMIENKSKMY